MCAFFSPYQSHEPQLASDSAQEDIEVVQTSDQLDTFAVSG